MVNEELQRLHDEFSSVKGEFTQFIDGWSDNQFRWKPAADQWSAGECIEHLCVTGELLVPRIEEAVGRGRDQQILSNGPFTYSWLGRLFIDSLQPSATRKMRTMRIYVPTGFADRAELTGRFVRLQDALLRAIAHSDGLDLVRVKVPSPANRLLRMSLGVWYHGTLVHERRHIAQAARLRSAAGFPVGRSSE